MLTLYLSLIDTQEEKDKFEYIYINFRKQMLYLANQYVNNPYDAEDIVHNTFLSIAKNIHIFDDKEDSSIYSYLICATKGHAQNFIRKNNNDEKYIKQLCNKLNTESTYYNFDSEINYRLLIESIRNLDGVYSDVLYLYYVEEFTYKEIASLLDRKPATVRKQIERGKDLLCFDLKMKGYNND